ncbi:MAG TPA: MFS transporter, partial [Marmoricola sp.]|nr:MFS transporter [Marmoricola sp.]
FYGVSTLMTIALVATVFFLPSTPPTGRRTSLADPFRALKHKPLLLLAITAVFYNIGFFTILAAGPFALPSAGILEIGWIFFGWGVLLAVTSVAVAPMLQRFVGTMPALLGTLAFFAVDLALMAVFTAHTVAVVLGIIVAGAFIGINNTLVTEAVMKSAPVERPVASAAYSFVRFIGGAFGPYAALKLGETVNSHAPFWFGAAAVLIAVVVVAAGLRTISRAVHGEVTPALHSEAEAESVLVGDLD